MSSHPPPAPNPSSEASSSTHSRSASVNSLTIHQHAPLTPSGLRETQTLSVSPDDTRDERAEASGSEISPGTSPAQVGGDHRIDSVPKLPTITAEGEDSEDEDHKRRNEGGPAHENISLLGQFGEEVARETTSLLRKPIEFVTHHAHSGPCNHGTFSPQPNSRAASIKGNDGNNNDSNGSGSRGIFGSIADSLVGSGSNVAKKMSTTARLAEEHGIKNSSVMYVSYIVLKNRPYFQI